MAVTHQVGHHDGIHDDGLGGGPQGELEPPRRLTWADVETMSFQQEVLQLVLGCHDILHLQSRQFTRAKLGFYFILQQTVGEAL